MFYFLERIYEGESPAIEVLKYRELTGNEFLEKNQDIRSPRPPHVKYSVGQVVRYKKTSYRGVIIGWEDKVSCF